MASTPAIYRAAARVVSGLAPVLAHLSPKLAAGHRGRHGAAQRLLAWGSRSRDAARPLAWFHASSVGEGLQAESVLHELRRRCPTAQYVYTHFSPSAVPLARRLPVDIADYLPYDLAGPVERLLGSLAPDLLVFSKLDLWPELAVRAAARGATVAVVAATVSPGSGRLRWPARALLRAGYEAVGAAAAVSGEDAERLARLGVSPERIRVLGDPRYDSVVERIAGVGEDEPLLQFGRGAPTLVAGSTWPEDEAVLLGAFARVRATHPDARLVLVPHEPTERHLAGVERAAARLGVSPPRLLSQAREPVPLLLVDRVGVLARLYGAGTMAYVGGGFGGAGLHSVLEPAAWGLPVCFGPRWKESRDAAALLQEGAALALIGRGQAAGEELAGIWAGWIEREDERKAAGSRGKILVERGLGASARTAELLAELISSRRPRTSPTGAPPGQA
ncbi:MAG TPA: glycosyltransferase N-terminal domain-containing protein [Gemmatimonadales bacterium]|nr:glycosyltransferase N-terminal domain-containing protein [Gemmatimonadales bacterium]